MKNCVNHPEKEAHSICHGCKKEYCKECLDEGVEYYYCKNPACQELLEEEKPSIKAPQDITCPNCESELELSDEERIYGKIHCPICESILDFRSGTPKILKRENYQELISSLNQGDIALIKSILDEENVDYFILGENFLGIRPLLEPAQIFVNVNQIDEVKELLKDFKANIFGISTNQDE